MNTGSETFSKCKFKVLVFSPHPDDAELAMGGAIAGMIKQGIDVTIADITDGEPTPHGSKAIRLEESIKASEALGVTCRLNLGLPNRRLENKPDYVSKLAQTIRLLKPDVIFGPARADHHPDHIAAESLITSARFAAKYHKTEMAGSPFWCEKRLGYFSPHIEMIKEFSFVTDISDTWADKQKSIRAYKSQLTNDRNRTVGLVEKVEVTNRYFGASIGKKYAEAFYSYQPVELKIGCDTLQ